MILTVRNAEEEQSYPNHSSLRSDPVITISGIPDHNPRNR